MLAAPSGDGYRGVAHHCSEFVFIVIAVPPHKFFLQASDLMLIIP